MAYDSVACGVSTVSHECALFPCTSLPPPGAVIAASHVSRLNVVGEVGMDLVAFVPYYSI